MSLDPRFVLCPSLQEQFWDKDLNVPLSAGIVTFYEDNSRTTLKSVYTINGNGPYSDSSYVELPNPLILSNIGTFIDNNGNDIIPYLFPYDGNILTTSNTIDLYYITVYSAQGVLQFTREAWPNTTATQVNIDEVTNFIPNGQFLAHSNDPVVSTNASAVPSSASVTQIAQGGWTFQVPTGTSSVNAVSFVTNPVTTNPDTSANPRFSVNVQCTTPSNTDTFKDLCIKFPDVNKFGSATANYTLSFQGQSNNGTNVTIGVRILKYFGSGGSPSASTDTPFGTGSETILTSNSVYNIPGVFGNNAGTVLGSNNDDYVQIALRFPNSAFNVTLTDFVLTNGSVVLTGFPIATNAEMLSPSTAGSLPIPNPDGSDTYLPIKLGPNGFIFDHSEVGNITAKTSSANFSSSISTISNELACDGNQYSFTAYSPLGIPYKRLANTIFDSTSGAYFWGSGANWVNAYISTGSTSQIILCTNKLGSQTIPADSAGSTATGFTFITNANPGVSSAYNYKAYSNATGLISVISTFTNDAAAAAAAGTSTMTVTSYNTNTIAVGYYIFTIQAIAAASLAAGAATPGLYFTFSNHGTNFYVWFQVTTETDPAPGGTGIKCQLTSTMSIADVGAVIANLLNGFQTNYITVTGQPSGGAGSYFTFTSNGVTNAVWYQIAGSGSAPAGFLNHNVMVVLTGSEIAAQVASKTQQAINQAFFATPDLRGVTLRGQDTSGIWDVDKATRFSPNSMLAATNIGTLELSQITSHLHSSSGLTASLDATGQVNNAGNNHLGLTGNDSNTHATGPGTVTISGNVALTGGSESRPVNEYVFYAIKY